MKIDGAMLIGGQAVAGTGKALHAVNPATNEELEPAFTQGDAGHVDRAARLAWSAFDRYRALPLESRACFLEAIADEIGKLGDGLILRCMAETGLPRARLEGERARTQNQLRLFAAVVRSGRWMDLRVDTALPERVPPRPDLRMRNIPLGPVAVFGASNFPLAFSVAGGDTASAFAAGCPVIVKAHSAHPGTSALVGHAIQKAAAGTGMPEGVFALLFGSGRAIGAALVAHPLVKAVGFTGSRAGGTALMKIAAQRAEPIPVYAEMSSINPVFLLPGALASRAGEMAGGFVGSLTLGAGQFCTNPGLVIAVEGEGLDEFIEAARLALTGVAAQTMLTPGIHAAYRSGTGSLSGNPVVGQLALGAGETGPNQCRAGLFVTTAEAFTQDEGLRAEVFGAASLLVKCRSVDEAASIAESLEGQLTATLHMDEIDLALARQLLPSLERLAGRVICNGYPTGVEVCHAMVHGGPYPATSDGRSTSVGSTAINRFLRSVCYQDMPEGLLPEVLNDHGGRGYARLRNGEG